MSGIRAAAFWSMGAQYLVFVIQFAVSVVIARFFLAPAEVGLFGIALAAAMLVSVLQDFGLTRYIGAQAELDEATIRSCSSVALLFGAGVALLILLLSPVFREVYGEPRLVPLLAIVAASYLLVPFGIVPFALLQRGMQFRPLAFVTVGAAFANAAVAVGLAALGYSAFALAWGLVADKAVRAAGSMMAAGRGPAWPPRFGAAGSILRFGSAASILYVSGALGTRSPELIVGRLLGFAAVGLYGRAASLAAQLVTLVAGAVGAVFTPAFRQIRDSGGAMGPAYVRVVAGYTALTWPALAFLAAASTPLVLILYGEAWRGVAPLLAFIALAEMAFTALPLHMEIPVLMGRMRRLLALNLLDTAASIGLLAVGAGIGLTEAAGSRLLYGLVWLLIYGGFMRRLTGFSWGAMLSVHGRSALLAIATILPLLGLYERVPPDRIGLALLVGAAMAGALLWLAGLFVLRHPMRAEVLHVTAMLLARRRGQTEAI